MNYQQKRELINDCHAIDGYLTRVESDIRFQGNEQEILHLIRRVNAAVLKLASLEAGAQEKEGK